MNELPHLTSIFDHLKRGCHLGPDDEPEFSALASPRFEEYSNYFAALGFALVRHEREFFYFEPENPETIPDTLPRIATFDPGGLFAHDPQKESAITNFRAMLQGKSVIRFADLFTLGVTVTRADGRSQTYHDLREIESHGTTISIKVLFNLLLLKGQLRRDDCEVPFYLDEIESLDDDNRRAILSEARRLGFIAVTAAPKAVSEVDALYFVQPQNGKIILRKRHRMGVKRLGAATAT